MHLMNVDPVLNQKIIDLADSELNLVGDADHNERQIKILLEAYALLPQPVEQWDDPATYLANCLCIHYQELGLYEEAIAWGETALKSRKGRPDSGNLLSLGTAHFHNNQLDDAFKYFDLAYNATGLKNRAFLGYEPIYFDFYRDRKGIVIKKKK